MGSHDPGPVLPQYRTHWWKECESSTSWPSGARGLENGSSGGEEAGECSEPACTAPAPLWPPTTPLLGHWHPGVASTGTVVSSPTTRPCHPLNPSVPVSSREVSQCLPQACPHTLCHLCPGCPSWDQPYHPHPHKRPTVHPQSARQGTAPTLRPDPPGFVPTFPPSTSEPPGLPRGPIPGAPPATTPKAVTFPMKGCSPQEARGFP